MDAIKILFIASCFLISCSKKKTDSVQEHEAMVPDSVYHAEATKIVALTFDTLRNALTGAIGQGGFAYAVDFCSEKAVALTSTFADSVVISRTSLRYRNPENSPDSLSRRILLDWQRAWVAGFAPETKLVRKPEQGEIHVYKAILMQPMCLNCHGKPGTEIQHNTLEKIKQKYAGDRATDFKTGDLRGAWHVVFKE